MSDYASRRIDTPHDPVFFGLRNVRPADDTARIRAWLNEDHVRARYHLDGHLRDRFGAYDDDQVRRYLEALVVGTTTRALIGSVDAAPVSYWEFYPAETLPAVARLVPAGSWGLHALVGDRLWVGSGRGTALLDAATECLLDTENPPTVFSEPDVNNGRARRAFEKAGYAPQHEVRLESKTALLMIRTRAAAAAS